MRPLSGQPCGRRLRAAGACPPRGRRRAPAHHGERGAALNGDQQPFEGSAPGEQNRAFATRYDKLAVRYDTTVEITNINIYLRDLSNRA